MENARWMVPPQFAVWIPGGMPHSNRATPQAQLCFLFIEPGAAQMPDHCCSLKISPLVRELILALAQRPGNAQQTPQNQRLTQVLFDELPQQAEQQLQLPVSGHPKIRLMVETMEAEPAQWQTLSQWASRFAMSERNLARAGGQRNRAQFSPLAASVAVDSGVAVAGAWNGGAAGGAGARL